MLKRCGVCVLLVLAMALLSVPTFAGSAVVGSVAGSLNASVGGQAVLPHTVIFSGDSLQVKDGAAVLALDSGNRVALGKDTVASFLRNNDAVTVVLTEGNVSLFHPNSNSAVKVQVGNVTVEPVPGFKTLGDVAMANGTIVVTAKDGTLRVNENGRTVEVAKGKTIALTPKTARAPQTGGSQKLGGAPPWVDYAILGAAGVGAGFGIGAWTRAGHASSHADSAEIAAAAAGSAVASAASAFSSELSAHDATATANTNNVGCALNTLATSLDQASPYAPPPGSSCPQGFVSPTGP